MKRLKQLSLIFLGLILVSLLILFMGYYYLLKKPLIVIPHSAILCKIDKNDTAIHLIQQLKDKGLIQFPKLILAIMQYRGLTDKLKVGVYEIRAGEAIDQLFNKIVHAKGIIRSVSIIPGMSLNQVNNALSKAPFLNYSLQDLAEIASDHPNGEGLLLADTYYYQAGSSAKTVLNLANRHLLQFLQRNWQTRQANLPYKDAYQLLIVASILEKETAIINERYVISGIIVNRLLKNMPLQMDPTVIYGLGDHYQGKLHHQDLRLNSSYNTYLNRGLPPTPIAMPSKQSIMAAAHPKMTNYWYFVAKGDGSHLFSSTYKAHRKAIRQN